MVRVLPTSPATPPLDYEFYQNVLTHFDEIGPSRARAARCHNMMYEVECLPHVQLRSTALFDRPFADLELAANGLYFTNVLHSNHSPGISKLRSRRLISLASLASCSKGGFAESLQFPFLELLHSCREAPAVEVSGFDPPHAGSSDLPLQVAELSACLRDELPALLDEYAACVALLQHVGTLVRLSAAGSYTHASRKCQS